MSDVESLAAREHGAKSSSKLKQTNMQTQTWGCSPSICAFLSHNAPAKQEKKQSAIEEKVSIKRRQKEDRAKLHFKNKKTPQKQGIWS